MPHLQLLVALSSVLGAVVILAWRVRETTTPVTLRKIVIPPLGMSTGLIMFTRPEARVPLAWAAAAFALGALVFAVPLMRTSQLTLDGDVVRMRRSKAFLVILVALVLVRLALRAWVERYVSVFQTGALFFLLAFGAIVRWRVSMLVEYQRLVAVSATTAG